MTKEPMKLLDAVGVYILAICRAREAKKTLEGLELMACRNSFRGGGGNHHIEKLFFGWQNLIYLYPSRLF
jgi:hypothetical protein